MKRALLLLVVFAFVSALAVPCAVSSVSPVSGQLVLPLKFRVVQDFGGVLGKVLLVRSGLPPSMPVRDEGGAFVAPAGFFAAGRRVTVFLGGLQVGSGVAGAEGVLMPVSPVSPGQVLAVVESEGELPNGGWVHRVSIPAGYSFSAWRAAQVGYPTPGAYTLPSGRLAAVLMAGASAYLGYWDGISWRLSGGNWCDYTYGRGHKDTLLVGEQVWVRREDSQGTYFITWDEASSSWKVGPWALGCAAAAAGNVIYLVSSGSFDTWREVTFYDVVTGAGGYLFRGSSGYWGSSSAFTSDCAGVMVVGNGNQLSWFEVGPRRWVPGVPGALPEGGQVVVRPADGSLWLSGPSGVWVWKPGQSWQSTGKPLGQTGVRVQVMPDGSVWAVCRSAPGSGPYDRVARYRDGVWEELPLPAGARGSDTVLVPWRERSLLAVNQSGIWELPFALGGGGTLELPRMPWWLRGDTPGFGSGVYVVGPNPGWAPDLEAKWVWVTPSSPAPPGVVLMRVPFEVVQETDADLYARVDDYIWVWLDGEPAVSCGINTTASKRVHLGIGKHVLTVLARNDLSYPNPAGVLLSLRDAAGNVIVRSGEGVWETCGYVR